MNRLTLLVLYGGMSEEHPVSVKSARELAKHLDPAKYNPIFVYIGRDGRWLRVDAPVDEPERGTPVALSAMGLVALGGGQGAPVRVDVAFPMLHGRYGEDGAVQGALETCGVPYVGCGVAASALCMDKALTHLVAAAAGVRVPRNKVIGAGDEIAAGALPYPLFVKPARSGSSFGVSKVDAPGALEGAVREARRYDDKVLLEEAIEGSEVGCAVLGSGDALITGALDMIELRGGFFRIHQEERPEQGSENSTVRVPAPVSEDARERVVAAAKAVYRALGCRGLARVDLFLTPDGEVVLNEVNTMPGFTSYSRYPRMMAGAGMGMGEVVDRLVGAAVGIKNEELGTSRFDRS